MPSRRRPARCPSSTRSVSWCSGTGDCWRANGIRGPGRSAQPPISRACRTRPSSSLSSTRRLRRATRSTQPRRRWHAGREPTWLLYTLVSHWRRLLQARAIRDRGGTLADLQARLSEHPFVLEKAFRQAADYSAAELDRGFHELLKLEEQIKLGELDARLAVEGFILEQVLSGTR